MTDTRSPLSGIGVLITRPRAQAAELMEAIEHKGGKAFCFPVIEVVPRNHDDIAADVAVLPDPDIALFVSRNAVEHGLAFAQGAILGAVGPTTAAAIAHAGQSVKIQSEHGFDSESLLAEAELKDVAGKQIRIIRGGDGRELLAETLRERGAFVHYLPVYQRRSPEKEPQQLADIESAWRAGKIHVITVMSVESLKNLTLLLPEWCAQQIACLPLVTPAARVIKEAIEHYPDARPILAAGPQTTDMVAAIQTLIPGISP